MSNDYYQHVYRSHGFVALDFHSPVPNYVRIGQIMQWDETKCRGAPIGTIQPLFLQSISDLPPVQDLCLTSSGVMATNGTLSFQTDNQRVVFAKAVRVESCINTSTDILQALNNMKVQDRSKLSYWKTYAIVTDVLTAESVSDTTQGSKGTIIDIPPGMSIDEKFINTHAVSNTPNVNNTNKKLRVEMSIPNINNSKVGYHICLFSLGWFFGFILAT